MFGMKDDGMRAMRLKAKSKYLDDLLEDNDGKMAVEIKKVYAKPGSISSDGAEEEEGYEEESKTGENEIDLTSELMSGVDKMEKLIQEKTAAKNMAPEEELSEEEIIRMIKRGNLAKLLK